MEQEPQLPYQPIVFIKTGVVGGTHSTSNTHSHSYDFTHRHILQPHYLHNHNPAYYILFHTPSVYNWLRTVPCRESELLNTYILNPSVGKVLPVVCEFDQILKSLEDFVGRWQVAKVSFASSVYISKVREFGGGACQHLSKTEQRVLLLNYDKNRQSTTCSRVRCKQCKRQIEVEAEIRQLAPCFVSRFAASRLLHKTTPYQASIVIGKASVSVRAANKVWYRIDLKSGQTKSVGVQNVEFKQSLLIVYRKEEQQQQSLVRAMPLEEALLGQTRPASNPNNQLKPPQAEVQPQPAKEVLPANKPKGYKQQSIQKPQQRPQKIHQLKFQPNKVLLPSNEKAHSYIKQVEKQYLQPKVKDSYELDYDRGKLKKKKEKRQYLQPDFNEVFAQVKSREQQGVSQESRKIKKKERRDRKREINFGPDSD